MMLIWNAINMIDFAIPKDAFETDKNMATISITITFEETKKS